MGLGEVKEGGPRTAKIHMRRLNLHTITYFLSSIINAIAIAIALVRGLDALLCYAADVSTDAARLNTNRTNDQYETGVRQQLGSPPPARCVAFDWRNTLMDIVSALAADLEAVLVDRSWYMSILPQGIRIRVAVIGFHVYLAQYPRFTYQLIVCRGGVASRRLNIHSLIPVGRCA
jgi:hypothetical protein